MSRSVFRTALRTAFVAGLVLVAGCTERPSAAAYTAFETKQRAKGNLRIETAPADAPYDAADLVRNFERIALRHEANAAEVNGEGNWKPNPVQRWVGPLRYRLLGNGVTPEDRAETARLMDRIAGLTGLEIVESEVDSNYWILISTPEERGDISARLARIGPRLVNAFEFWLDNRQVFCIADNMFGGDGRNQLVGGLVVIGSETSGILRRACLHEEIVQSLGLANDHPDVRPSIFNDDGEFALLTEHDEHLLRILYDPRLEPGMTAEEAMPIVRRIVAGIPLGRPAARLAAGAVTAGGLRPAATQDVPGY